MIKFFNSQNNTTWLFMERPEWVLASNYIDHCVADHGQEFILAAMPQGLPPWEVKLPHGNWFIYTRDIRKLSVPQKDRMFPPVDNKYQKYGLFDIVKDNNLKERKIVGVCGDCKDANETLLSFIEAYGWDSERVVILKQFPDELRGD